LTAITHLNKAYKAELEEFWIGELVKMRKRVFDTAEFPLRDWTNCERPPSGLQGSRNQELYVGPIRYDGKSKKIKLSP
jgi:hypothetical protein